MVKRIVWTQTAVRARKDILSNWIIWQGTGVYARRLSRLFRVKVALLQSMHYQGRATDVGKTMVSMVSHFLLFYTISEQEIVITGIWDNWWRPEDLRENLEEW